jgi:long-chain acyl-CoA synthetase
VIIVGKLDDFENQRKGIPEAIRKISIDYFGITEGIQWKDLVSSHEPLARFDERPPDELLTIMYTSGTTGSPKGAMFNAKAFDHATRTFIPYLKEFGELPDHPVLFSYLPLCHIAERALTEMIGCYMGADISFVESMDTFAHDLAWVQPEVFFGVPRIWVKFQEKILQKLSQRTLGWLLKIPILSEVIRRSLKRKMGLSRSVNGTAAAPIPVSLLKWFDRLGITVREIYGMTENCALSHANQGEIRFGTVGQSMNSVEVQFSDESEIWIRHPALMMGYFKEPGLTAGVITQDGFLKTGDQGNVDKDGFLTITGRVKDLFKTDKGKYISPAPIEMRILKNADIDNACVVGMGIPQPIVLITLSASGKAKSQKEIIQSLSVSINEINPTLEHYEFLKKAVIMKNDWTIENGLMTPTLKVKRNEVEKIHLPSYPKWYVMKGLVVWE